MKFLLLAVLALFLLSRVWVLALLILFYLFFKNSNGKQNRYKRTSYQWRPYGARWK